MIDLWGKNSRDEFIDCQYWKTNENNYKNDRIVYENEPSGFFRAKEVNSYAEDNQVIGQAFMVTQYSVTLESHDDLSDLSMNDLVVYEGNIYRVDSCQRTPVKKQKMFMGNSYSNTFFITLRR